MARARNIKPGFFSNDDLGECLPLTRLMFIGMWTMADRRGRMEDRPKKIKATTLPYDNADCDEMLNELVKHGFIIRYSVDGNNYIQIVNWDKHQNPHIKEPKSEIPEYCENGIDLIEENTKTISEPIGNSESTVQEQCSNSLDPADSGFLIPDSGFLIPDSKNDTPELRECSAGDTVNPENKNIGDVSKKPPKQTQGYEYPERLNLQAWSEWLEYRKENRIKPYKKTKTGELAVINNLLEMSGGDPSIQDQIVKQSIGQNWQGLFPLKNIRPIQNGMAQTNIQAAQQAAQRAKASGIGSYDDNTVF